MKQNKTYFPGENLKRLRKKKGLTQTQLAERVGVTYQSIGQYERGETSPSGKTLKKLADALDVGFYDLLDQNDSFFSEDPRPYIFQFAHVGSYEELIEKFKEAYEEGDPRQIIKFSISKYFSDKGISRLSEIIGNIVKIPEGKDLRQSLCDATEYIPDKDIRTLQSLMADLIRLPEYSQIHEYPANIVEQSYEYSLLKRITPMLSESEE